MKRNKQSEASMKMRFLRLLFGCTFAMLACISIALGQTVTGSVTGVVTDPSGAVVPGAHVVAHNLDTGIDSPATTNSTGLFRIDFLPIGRYQVSVQANGFETATIPAFTLEVLQTATFNVKLTVGSSSTTVNVTASAAPILNTNDATLGVTFSANEIQNVPLDGLNFSMVTMFLPGAVNTSGTSGMSGGNAIERNTSWSGIPSINGNRSQANNYTLDGIDMNEPGNNLIAYNPAPEAIDEIKVVTANAPADYGNVNGGDVVSILKSGTNRFHGSAYGFLQNNNLNANSWSNDNQGNKIATYTQTQFGGTIGGPIKKNKLFFFGDYLGARWHTGQIGEDSVMPDGTGTGSAGCTSNMRLGDFSCLLSANAGDIQLYDTQNNFKPYDNNQNIPIVNPVAKFLFAHSDLYPSPNHAPSDSVLANNYRVHQKKAIQNDQGDVKIEYDPKDTDKITGFYSMSNASDASTAILAIDFPSANRFPTRLGGANWVHIFSPAIVNSARIGFTRALWFQNNPTDPSGQFGLTGDQKIGIPFPKQSDVGYTQQSVSGIDAGGNAAYDGNLVDNTFTYTDNLAWQHGLHTFSMGVQAMRYQSDYTTDNNSGFLGSMNYNGTYTSNPNVTTGPTGYGGADFLLDRINNAQATLSGDFVGNRQWRVAGFVNDDWKVLPNLTVNLGLRWEYDQPWYEVNNKTGNILLSTGQAIYAGKVPAGAEAGSGVCSNRGCYNANYRQWMPRIGFSYQASNRLVVRAGYGATSFFEGNFANQRLTSINPFVQAAYFNPLTPTTTSGGDPRTAEEGFTGPSGNGGSYNIYPQDIQPAFVQEWSLTTEYALTRTTSLQVGYLGEQGQHIEDYGDVNQYAVNGDPTTAPYYNNQYLGVNAPLGFGVGSGAILITESRAMMNYNALQSVLRQRVSHGLELTLNYTFGKAMTNSLGNYGLGVNGYSGAFQNYYNSSADYGVAGTDVKHNFSGVLVYALPVGRGQQFLSNSNRALDAVVGGWKIATSGFIYSGLPESVTGPGNNSGNPWGSSRANQYRQIKIVHRSYDHWFGTDPSAQPCTAAGVDNGVCAFGAPASNTFGNSSNGSIRGPGFATMDASASKEVHIFGEHAFGLRIDAFNVFNHPSYTNPDTNIQDAIGPNSGFGSAVGTRSTERHMQVSAKYHF